MKDEIKHIILIKHDAQVWNSLTDHLRDPTLGSDCCFKSRLKTHLFSLY